MSSAHPLALHYKGALTRKCDCFPLIFWLFFHLRLLHFWPISCIPAWKSWLVKTPLKAHWDGRLVLSFVQSCWEIHAHTPGSGVQVAHWNDCTCSTGMDTITCQNITYRQEQAHWSKCRASAFWSVHLLMPTCQNLIVSMLHLHPVLWAYGTQLQGGCTCIFQWLCNGDCTNVPFKWALEGHQNPCSAWCHIWLAFAMVWFYIILKTYNPLNLFSPFVVILINLSYLVLVALLLLSVFLALSPTSCHFWSLDPVIFLHLNYLNMLTLTPDILDFLDLTACMFWPL